jgi:ATP-dependent protease ClpP protease subunit
MTIIDIENTTPKLNISAPEISHIVDLGVDIKNRIIYFDDFEEESGQWFLQVVKHFEGKGSEPIDIMLNTPGGDVISMFAVHDVMRNSPLRIKVTGYGQVCSAGVLVLAAGDERYVTESCSWMSHEPTSGGDPDLGLRAAKSRRKWEDWSHIHWCYLMSCYTPYSPKWWEKHTEKNAEYWLLGGREIVDAGLADTCIEPVKPHK